MEKSLGPGFWEPLIRDRTALLAEYMDPYTLEQSAHSFDNRKELIGRVSRGSPDFLLFGVGDGGVWLSGAGNLHHLFIPAKCGDGLGYVNGRA